MDSIVEHGGNTTARCKLTSSEQNDHEEDHFPLVHIQGTSSSSVATQQIVLDTRHTSDSCCNSCHGSSNINEKSSTSWSGLLRLLFIKRLSCFWPQLLLCLILVCIDVALNVSFSIALGQLVSLGQVADDENVGIQISNHSTTLNLNDTVPLLKWVSVMFGSVLLHFIVGILSSFLQVTMAVQISTNLRKQFSLRLHQVSLSFFNAHSKQDILSRFVQDVNKVENLVAHPLRSIMFTLVLGVTYIIYTLIVSWPLGVGVFALLTASFLLLCFLSVHFNDRFSAKDQVMNQLRSVLVEEIDGYHVNRMYDLSNYWSSRVESILHLHYRNKARCSLFFTQFLFLSRIMVAMLVCTVITFSTVLLIKLGWLSLDIGLTLIVLLFIVFVNMISLSSVPFPHLQSSAMALNRINILLCDQKYDTSAQQHTQSHTESKCEHTVVELKAVCYSYNSTGAHNLCSVSLKFKDGERVAIVGKSGSRKSMLLKLMLQMDKPTLGEVVVRKDTKMSAVFSYNHIFKASIRENIRFGNLKASDKDVEEVAKMADLHVWVNSLQCGYDTVISNESELLERGVKQRIALARMFLSRAKIYLLDEVTSGLDQSAGALLFDKVMQLTAGKTVIATTAQVKQAKQFDRIVVLSNGRVKEQGTHDELFERKGEYWQMWNKSDKENEDIKNPTYIVQRHGGSTTVTPSTINDLTIIPMTVTPGRFFKDDHHDRGKTRVNTTPTTFTPLDTFIEVHESVMDDDTIKQTPENNNQPSLSSGGYVTADGSSNQDEGSPQTETRLQQHGTTLSINGSPIPITTSTPSLKPQFQNQDSDEFMSDCEWYETKEDVRSKFTLCALSGVSPRPWWACGEDDSSERGCGQDTNTGTVYEHKL